MYPEVLRSPIGPFIDRDVPTIEAKAPIQRALSKFQDSRYHVVFITDAPHGKLVGIITTDDVTRYAQDRNFTEAVQLCSSSKLIAIPHDVQLWEAMSILNGDNSSGKPLDYLPVVDPEQKPVGILSRSKLGIKLGEVKSP